MNNLQPYEKRLAEKLGQVPVPDKNEGWIEMRKLLDRDMPEGGGGWSGNRKWWWMGLTVAIIMGGVWTSQQFNQEQHTASQVAIATENSNGSGQQSLANKENPGTDKENSTTNKRVENSMNDKISAADDPARKEHNGATTNSNIKTDRGANKNKLTNDLAIVSNSQSGKGNEKINDKKDEVISKPRELASVNNPLSGNQRANKDILSKSSSSIISTAAKQNPSIGVVNQSFAPDDANGKLGLNKQSSRLYKTPEENAFISSYIMPANLTQQTFRNPADDLDEIAADKQPLKAEPGKTDKLFAKEMRKKSIKEDNRKMSRRSMRGIGFEKEHELTFAAGLSVPQSFAIGPQQSPSYGVNAKSGKASDYIPVPFFQYHINNRLFVQTEFQFQSPQLTDRLLISQSQHQVAPANGMLEKNIYIEKLYYFNIPLNVYFSPVRNFYIGSGIQYSSLLSGVATYQDNRYVNGSLQNSSSRVQGFKDDSVAAKLAPSEFRYQLEGNYYFNRFTFGARYNQALKQFVNVQPSPNMPFTQGRNQSFLIYLRYNIWEERKKNMYSIAGD